MLKSSLRMLLLTTALIFAVEPLQSVQGILLPATELAMLNAPDTPGGDTRVQSEDRGNGFVRALRAPFKAIGRLFHRGKKDEVKLERTSEKDAKKFAGQSANSTTVSQLTPSQKPISAGPSATDHLASGRALLNAGSLNEAIAELSTALSLDPKLSEAQTLLGVAYDRKGLAARAEAAFETALHAPDDEAMHLNNLGYLQYKNGEYDKAVKYLKRAAKLAPNDQRIWNNLALTQSQLGKFNDAYKSFVHAGGEFNGHLNIADRLERQGSTREAIKHLEKARELRSESVEVLSRLVALYQTVGQLEKAESAHTRLALLQSVTKVSAQK